MKTKLSHLFAVFAMILALHLFAVFAKLYNGSTIWIDIPQHLLAGVFLSMIFVYVAKKNKYFSSDPSSFLFMFSVVSFALLGSFAWEIIEFLFWKFLPHFAEKLKWYSPDILDALSDMAAGLLGGVAFAVVSRTKKEK